MKEKILVNLTLLLVKEQLERYKITESDIRKEAILANPNSAKHLLEYILSHIPNIYTLVREEADRDKYKQTGQSLEQIRQIEKLIDRGITEMIASEPVDRCIELICCRN